MDKVVVVTGLTLAFSASHIIITFSEIRGPLTRRWGELGFALINSVVSWTLFSASLFYYDAHRHAGPPALGLADHPNLATGLGWLAAIGMCLMFGALAPGRHENSAYGHGPNVPEPHGLHRVTRHPFFLGVVLYLGAHAVLSATLVGVAYFSSLSLLAIVGPIHQDHKLARDKGDDFVEFLARTSAIPFLAILQGRQVFELHELPWRAMVVGAMSACLLRWMHGTAFADNYGVWLVFATIVALPAAFIIRSWLNQRGHSSRSREAA